MNAPRVSVIMANFNGRAHIGEAVHSVLAQTEHSLELIVADDGSTDDSLAVAEAAAGGDGRLKFLPNPAQTGPAAARNRAVAAATGRWVAIVDNDDRIEPDRLARLIDAAEADAADIAADDLLTFYEHSARKPHRHLRATSAQWIDAARYANANVLLRGGAQLGYLKPVFKRSLLGAQPYNETLRIGEDSDLVQRLLIGGARMRVYPFAGYQYRKHAGSISHRLTSETLAPMLAALNGLGEQRDGKLNQALQRQRRAIRDALAYADLIAALKSRRAGGVAHALSRRPGALLLLKDPVGARLNAFAQAR